MANTKEKGNIFFLYRPKVDADSAKDVQRFYIVLHNGDLFRLLIVGRKKLPQDDEESGPQSGNWALVREVTKDSDTIEAILKGGEYETKTRGTQHLPSAAPVGEGRYAIVEYDGQTAIVYKLKREKSARIRKLFGIQKEASLIMAVKNPDMHVSGFPESKPSYDSELTSLFKNRRWIAVENLELINHTNTQLVLISALDKGASGILSISLDESKQIDLADHIDFDLPQELKLENTFPNLEEFRQQQEMLQDVRFGEGGKKGGKEAARTAESASGLARLLSGIDLPAQKEAIIQYVEAHEGRVDDTQMALNRLKKIDNKQYTTMAEIQEAVFASTGSPPFRCELCGEEFDSRSDLKRHLQTSHPERAVSAADIQQALSGVTYPKSTSELSDFIGDDDSDIAEAIRQLPDKEYHDAAEVAIAFQESITGEESDMRESPREKAMKSDSAAAIAKALKGVELPKQKEEILQFARKQDIRQDILEVLEELPDQKFADMSDITKAVGEVKN